jgi:uncharacterized membrane protein
MEDLFKLWTAYLALGVEASAGVIIGLGAVEATYKALILFFGRRSSSEDVKEDIRLQFGRWLSLGLEFELGADILRTAISPTWTEIGQLAAIVVLRTALNFFLQLEIDKAAERKYSNMSKEGQE